MLLRRVITVIVAIPFVVGLILCPVSAVFKTLIALCLLSALWEFFTIVNQPKVERFFFLIMGLFHILFILFCPDWIPYLPMELTLLILITFGFYCLSPSVKMEGIGHRVALTLMGVFYVGTLGAMIGLIRDFKYGIFWISLLLAMTWLNDTFAYFAGHRFGKHRLAPQISPGKTIEGFLGGFLGSFVGFLIVWVLIDNQLALLNSLWLVLLVGFLGPLGDLSESLFKRSFGIKDSGNIIPGHGGMLDRIDALLLTAPAIYFYAMLLGLDQ